MARGGKVYAPLMCEKPLCECDNIAPRMRASDIALLVVGSMAFGFVIALLTLGEVVPK